MGKTEIVRKFERDHPPVFNATTGVTTMPVVMFQIPPEPVEGDFYAELLRAIGVPTQMQPHPRAARDLARQLLVEMGTRMLILDEVHAMLAGTHRQQRIFLNTIRFLTNDLRIPIVCAGTQDARIALLTDPQLAERFDALYLDHWCNDQALQRLLASFAAILPLRGPVQIESESVRRRVIDMTDGNTAFPGALPIAPRPFASELISSWLARTACRYDLSLGAMARHFGGEARLCPIGAPALDYDPPAPLIDAVAGAVRLSVPEIRTLALKAIWPRRPWHRFAWAHVGPDPVTGRLLHTRQLAVAWCPLCLRDDRQNSGAMYLRRQWALATCGYCHRHQFPLQDICPACHAANRECFVAAGRTTLLVCRSCGSALDRMPDGSRTEPMIRRRGEAASIFEQNFDRAVDGWMPDQFAFNNTSARELVAAIDRALGTLVRVEGNDVAPAFPIPAHRCQRFPLAGARPAARRRLLAAARTMLAHPQPAISRSSAKSGAGAVERASIVNRWK